MSLATIISDNVLFHTRLQSELFIVNAAGCGSAWGMYRQACREVVSRIRPLVECYQRTPSEVPVLLALEEAEIAEREKEFMVFYHKAMALKPVVDSYLSPEDAELTYWISKFKRQAAIDLISQGRVSPGTIEAILNLPTEARQNLLEAVLNKPHEVMEQVTNEVLIYPELDPKSMICQGQVRELVCSPSLLEALG